MIKRPVGSGYQKLCHSTFEASPFPCKGEFQVSSSVVRRCLTSLKYVFYNEVQDSLRRSVDVSTVPTRVVTEEDQAQRGVSFQLKGVSDR